MEGPIEQRLREIAEATAAECAVEIVHSEIESTKRDVVVRVFIDKSGGVGVDDCEAVSRSMEIVLDSEDLISSAYVLEVSSPGLERGLYSISDFEKFIGSKVKVKLASSVKGKKIFIGRIQAVEGEEIVIGDKASGDVRFPFSTVSKANLRVDLEDEFKKKR